MPCCSHSASWEAAPLLGLRPTPACTISMRLHAVCCTAPDLRDGVSLWGLTLCWDVQIVREDWIASVLHVLDICVLRGNREACSSLAVAQCQAQAGGSAVQAPH